MIHSFCVSLRGQYHDSDGSPCQDATCYRVLGERSVVAAVADGLGSERHSDVGSRIAVTTVTDYCSDNIGSDTCASTIPSILQKAFSLALEAIENAAYAADGDLSQYDTTLSVAVLRDSALWFGHVGDSGIISLSTDGKYRCVTKQQRDENGLVYPLFARNQWKFDLFDRPVVSVLLATDGLLNGLFLPPILHDQTEPIYILMARGFMDPVQSRLAIDGDEVTANRFTCYINSIPAADIDDDKTVLVITDDTVSVPVMDSDYYSAPNWEVLRERLNNELYGPVIKSAEKTTEKSGNDQTDEPPESRIDGVVGSETTAEQSQQKKRLGWLTHLPWQNNKKSSELSPSDSPGRIQMPQSNETSIPTDWL